jgi:hypothetical protein
MQEHECTAGLPPCPVQLRSCSNQHRIQVRCIGSLGATPSKDTISPLKHATAQAEANPPLSKTGQVGSPLSCTDLRVMYNSSCYCAGAQSLRPPTKPLRRLKDSTTLFSCATLPMPASCSRLTIAYLRLPPLHLQYCLGCQWRRSSAVGWQRPDLECAF